MVTMKVDDKGWKNSVPALMKPGCNIVAVM
jgi:hypothetical protein